MPSHDIPTKHREQFLKSNLNTPWYKRLIGMCGVYAHSFVPGRTGGGEREVRGGQGKEKWMIKELLKVVGPPSSLFKVTEPSSIPYRTHSACAKRAA